LGKIEALGGRLGGGYISREYIEGEQRFCEPEVSPEDETCVSFLKKAVGEEGRTWIDKEQGPKDGPTEATSVQIGGTIQRDAERGDSSNEGTVQLREKDIRGKAGGVLVLSERVAGGYRREDWERGGIIKRGKLILWQEEKRA